MNCELLLHVADRWSMTDEHMVFSHALAPYKILLLQSADFLSKIVVQKTALASDRSDFVGADAFSRP